MTVKKFIYVTFQKEGIHCYPEAATNPALATGDEYDVSFLANKHRHMFYFKVHVEVTSDNREIEFIQFKRWLQSLYAKDILQLDYRSCEMLANELYIMINKKYPNREIRIDISEDNENGAYVIYETN
jgi:hypothetical protein